MPQVKFLAYAPGVDRGGQRWAIMVADDDGGWTGRQAAETRVTPTLAVDDHVTKSVYPFAVERVLVKTSQAGLSGAAAGPRDAGSPLKQRTHAIQNLCADFRSRKKSEMTDFLFLDVCQSKTTRFSTASNFDANFRLQLERVLFRGRCLESTRRK